MANPDHLTQVRAAATPSSERAVLDSLDLSDALLGSIRLEGTSLRSAKLRKADLSGAYLRRADLSGADLTQARLALADLREAQLASAKLKSADLSNAVLAGANLGGADLTNCRLTKADLTGAQLTGAHLAKADLRGVRGLVPEQVKAARGWEAAVFDAPTAKQLGLDQPVPTGRHGAAPAKATRRRGGDPFVVDVVFRDRRPTFGDLYLLCDDGPHPHFPPSGGCDLSGLRLGFEQVDDFFAVRSRGRELIWLYPLVRDGEAPHHPGPFDAIRLEWAAVSPTTRGRFVDVVTSVARACGGAIHAVDGRRRAEAEWTVEELRSAVDGASGRGGGGA